LVNNGHSALQDGSAVTGTVTNNDGSLVANGARLANLVTNAGTVTLNDSIVKDVSSNGGQTALAGTSAGTVTNAANATFSATGGSQASTTNSGVMTLAGGNKTDGAVTNTGNGSLTLNGSTIGGTLTHDGQNLTVTSNNASAGSLAGNGNGTLDGTLTLTKASDTYAGSLSGNGGLTIDGGTEILTGDSTYSGPTMIQNQATLEVDGRNGSSPVSVGNGATLRGTGTVGSTQAVSGATVAPGAIGSDALSTLHVSGNLTMAKGSVLRIRGTSDTTGRTIDTAKGNGFHELTSDRLAVTGTAYLQGGTLDLQLKNAGAGLTYGQAYRVLTASGGVNGQFDEKLSSNLAPQYAYLDPAFAYSADAVDIVLRRNASSFSTVGETRNQITTGQGLDHLAPSSALSQAMTGLTRDQARRALDNLSGELHASIRTALIQDSFYIRNAVMDRLANSDCDYGHNGQSLYDLKTHKKNGACYSDHAVLWGQAYGALGHNSGDGNAALMHHNTAGFIMGADAPINRSNWRVGGLLSYGHSQFNIQRGRSSSGNSNNITVGAYAGTHWGRLNLRLGAAYSWNVINTRRHVAVGDYGGRLSSGYLGGTAQTFAELGYKMRTGRGVFEPFMNVAYVNMQTNSYHEHGNEAALRSRGTDTGVTFSTFGFRAATTLNIGRTIFMPHLTAAYRHGFGRLGSRQHEAFATTGGTSDMDVAGVLLSSNAAVVNAGMTARLTDRIDLDLSYIGQYGNQSTESGATGTFKMKF
ncbi:autotransporter outer membrane beta-barrel domain-containing protein, partial [Parasaccharibacter apium]